MKTTEKIVFVLGAGFSKPAGLPLQKELLEKILKLEAPDINMEFELVRSDLKKFIERSFGNVEPKNLSLEDLFTIFDRAIINKENFISYEWKKLFEIKEELIHAIILTIDYYMEKSQEKIPKFYSTFANYIMNSTGEMVPSVVSLNWDSFLEYILYKHNSKIFIDYCTYAYKLNGEEVKYNESRDKRIKILKPHGSINWLYCPNCGRLFIDENKSIGIEDKIKCKFCNNNGSNIYLNNLIITPTMLKDLMSLHIKNIWQNMFLELQSAHRIVFIGYSFPIADYEIRYILRKAISTDAKVEVVFKNESKKTTDRYKNFFGDSIEIYNEGVEKWVQTKIKK